MKACAIKQQEILFTRVGQPHVLHGGFRKSGGLSRIWGIEISELRGSWRLRFGQVVVLMSTPYPENLSFKLALSLKIGGFE